MPKLTYNKSTIGFSLIELLIVITIVSILGAIAYPSYQTFRLESRRADAHAALIAAKGVITEYLVLHNKVILTAADATDPTLTKYFAPNTGKSKSGFYDISVSISGTAYAVTATAIGKQIDDTHCAQIILNDQGDRSPVGCW